jgi:hypothetical protein
MAGKNFINLWPLNGVRNAQTGRAAKLFVALRLGRIKRKKF